MAQKSFKPLLDLIKSNATVDDVLDMLSNEYDFDIKTHGQAEGGYSRMDLGPMGKYYSISDYEEEYRGFIELYFKDIPYSDQEKQYVNEIFNAENIHPGIQEFIDITLQESIGYSTDELSSYDIYCQKGKTYGMDPGNFVNVIIEFER